MPTKSVNVRATRNIQPLPPLKHPERQSKFTRNTSKEKEKP